MNTIANTSRIVVGIDGTADGMAAADFAARVAERQRLPLVLVHAYRRSPALNPLLPVSADPISARYATTAVAYRSYAPGFNTELMRDAGQQALDAVQDQLQATHRSLRIEQRLVPGSAARVLVAESYGAYLLVVARNHERSVERFFAGSTSGAVSAHAACPVAVVPTNWRDLPETGRVVVGLDAGHQESDVLTVAFEQASFMSAQLVALHSWEIEDYWNPAFEGEPTSDRDQGSGRRAVAEALAGWSTRYPDVHLSVSFTNTSAPRCLIEASDSADLLVVGSRGQGGLRGLALGSTARSVVNHATCPVIVVRHAGARSKGDDRDPAHADMSVR
jgi:nucleotide-binding universal stress UspA family protein